MVISLRSKRETVLDVKLRNPNQVTFSNMLIALRDRMKRQSFASPVPLPIVLLVLLFVQCTMEQILLPLETAAAQLTVLRI